MTNDEIYVVVRPWLARVLAMFQKIGWMSEQVSESNKVRPTTNELLALSLTERISLPDRWPEVSEAIISGNGNRILECVDCINEVRGRWLRAMRNGYFDFDIMRDDQDTFNNCIDGMRRLDIKPDVQWLNDVIRSISGDIDRRDAELSVSHPFQILSVGNAAIAKAQKAVLDTLAIPNQVLSNKGPQREKNADCRVDSKFPKPDDSLTNVAIEHLQKTFHKLPHAGTAKASHVIATAVKEGIQRNAVEWALIRMQEYGWIKLSIPVWGGVIGTSHSEPTFPAPVQEQKRWYFGTQEYDIRLTEYFYNPSYCITCSKLIGDFDYDPSECHDCRSQLGKLLDVKVAIHASGDSPDRIPEWKMIRALLRDAFGSDRTIEELWERMEDRLRVNGWDEERWLRTKYGDFIELLKSGLLNERPNPTQDDAAMSPANASNAATSLAKTTPKSEDPIGTSNTRETQNSAQSLESIKPSERQAYYSYKLAEAKAERRLEDQQAYDFLAENDLSEHFGGDLVDYQLPAFATWARQLRTARKATNERKYTPRTHR